MEKTQKINLSELFQNKKFLYTLPLFLLVVGALLWLVLSGKEEPQQPATALNTRVPVAPNDSTKDKKDKLAIQQNGDDATLEADPSSGVTDIGVDGEINRLMYGKPPRKFTEPTGVQPIDSGMTQPSSQPYKRPLMGASPGGYNRSAGRLPGRLQAGPVGGSYGSNMPVRESDATLSDSYGSAGEQEVAKKQAELARTMEQRNKLQKLLEQYQRDKAEQKLIEGDKRVVRKAEEPPLVASLTPDQGSSTANTFYGLYSQDAREVAKKQLDRETGTFRAMIFGDQDVVSSGRIKIRLLEPLAVRGIVVPANSLVYGIGSFAAERVNVKITAINYENHILPVNMTVFDMDGMAGIHVPMILGQAEAKQALGQTMNGVNLNYGYGSNVLASAGGSAANAAIQGVKQVVNRKARLQKAHIKANYYVLLRSAEGSATGGNTAGTGIPATY